MHRFYKVTGVSAKSCRGYQRTAGEGSCWGKAPKNTGDGQRYYRKLPGSRKCQELQGIPENCRGGELLGESTKKHWGWPEVLPEVAGKQEVPRVAVELGGSCRGKLSGRKNARDWARRNMLNALLREIMVPNLLRTTEVGHQKSNFQHVQSG